jgi:hypothetical protein
LILESRSPAVDDVPSKRRRLTSSQTIGNQSSRFLHRHRISPSEISLGLLLFMSSSNSSSSNSSTPSSSEPAGSGGRLYAGDHGHTRSYGSPEILSDADYNTNVELERRRARLVAMDRKQRFTAASNDDDIPQRRQTILSEADPGSSSRTDFHRPLPTLPSGGNESVYAVPGSSRETAIDIFLDGNPIPR